MDDRESRLYKDLLSDSRDVMYRAMTYLQRHGAILKVGTMDDLAGLLANRGPMLTWLLEHPDRETLISGYVEYWERWSPVFQVEPGE